MRIPVISSCGMPSFWILLSRVKVKSERVKHQEGQQTRVTAASRVDLEERVYILEPISRE